MKTRLTEMFGIELPIFAFSHCRDVVVAVSEAGGMGVLGVSSHSPEQVERELACTPPKALVRDLQQRGIKFGSQSIPSTMNLRRLSHE